VNSLDGRVSLLEGDEQTFSFADPDVMHVLPQFQWQESPPHLFRSLLHISVPLRGVLSEDDKVAVVPGFPKALLQVLLDHLLEGLGAVNLDG